MPAENIGYIESVNDQQIVVRMSKAAEAVGGEEASTRSVRVGSYVVISQEEGDLLAMVTAQDTRQSSRLAQNSPEEKSTVITVLAVGVIREGKFHRGIGRYPVVGEAIRAADDADLATIFTSWDSRGTDEQGTSQEIGTAEPVQGAGRAGEHPASLALGRFTPNQKYEVSLDGKTFCARHAAILGSSGSGKSCTVAQIVQQAVALPGTQVILFDLHGEYLSAFSDEKGEPLSNVAYISGNELVLPYWLLKYEEMEELFLDRSNPLNVPSQRTFLKQALLRLRHEAAEALGLSSVYSVDSPVYFSLEQLCYYANNLNAARYVLNTERLAFRQTALRHLPPEEQEKLMVESEVRFNLGNPEGEIPHPVYHGRLGGLVNLLEQKMSDRRYDFLLRPIEQAGRSGVFRDLFGQDDNPAGFSRCLESLLGLLTGHTVPRKNLVILDLSRIPFETVDITVALLTRLLYEFNFWCDQSRRSPLLLVYEEAHNYIPADRPDSFARRAVERVAKEGRKYGVGALLVSQRPMELSETVLSQCNSFIIMRMSNPADQAYVSKVVSEHFSGLVGTLAQLRPGEAYAVGEAVPMPMRTQIYLTKHAPDSGDADFFGKDASEAQTKDIGSIVEAWWRQERPRRLGERRSSVDQVKQAEPVAMNS